jgi:EAL domain-containing protein (putative c-di-GMP-specific phosphodiesterase class I)
MLMRDAEAAVVNLLKLKAMGVLAIDDFGTGYSSFTYLRRFPSDALKLHQSFVQQITADPADAAIVSAMINLGRSLNQRVIAEGVETGEQVKFLQLHGCGTLPGFAFIPFNEATLCLAGRLKCLKPFYVFPTFNSNLPRSPPDAW